MYRRIAACSVAGGSTVSSVIFLRVTPFTRRPAAGTCRSGRANRMSVIPANRHQAPDGAGEANFDRARWGIIRRWGHLHGKVMQSGTVWTVRGTRCAKLPGAGTAGARDGTWMASTLPIDVTI